MSKFLQILIIATITVALCHAEAPRYRTTARLRNRFSARQEVAAAEEPAAVTPYPTANELKPEVPFEEGENTAATAVDVDPEVPHQPDETYGPPEVETNEEPAPVEEDQDEEVLDVAPDAEDEPVLVAVEQETVTSDEVPQVERLILGRRLRGGRFVASRPAKLQVRPARLQQRQQQRLFVANAPFVYAAQRVQAW